MSFYTEENCSIFTKENYIYQIWKKKIYEQQIQKNISIVYGQIGTEF